MFKREKFTKILKKFITTRVNLFVRKLNKQFIPSVKNKLIVYINFLYVRITKIEVNGKLLVSSVIISCSAFIFHIQKPNITYPVIEKFMLWADFGTSYCYDSNIDKIREEPVVFLTANRILVYDKEKKEFRVEMCELK